jgi:hypothetical protein
VNASIKDQMKIFRNVLNRCLEEELGMPQGDSYESEGRDNVLRAIMPQIEVLFLDAVSQERKAMPKGIKNSPLNLDAIREVDSMRKINSYPTKVCAPNVDNATAGRRLQNAYSKQFGLPCEDCGEHSLGRRFRCRDCNMLVCSWCSGHTHRCRA